MNTHVTAPGAIMALGLMYLKTNNRCVYVCVCLYVCMCVHVWFILSPCTVPTQNCGCHVGCSEDPL